MIKEADPFEVLVKTIESFVSNVEIRMTDKNMSEKSLLSWTNTTSEGKKNLEEFVIETVKKGQN